MIFYYFFNTLKILVRKLKILKTNDITIFKKSLIQVFSLFHLQIATLFSTIFFQTYAVFLHKAAYHDVTKTSLFTQVVVRFFRNFVRWQIIPFLRATENLARLRRAKIFAMAPRQKWGRLTPPPPQQVAD